MEAAAVGEIGEDGMSAPAGPVAVVGLGAMGSRIARRLHASGEEVVVWGRTAEKAVPFAGMSGGAVASSPAEAAATLRALDTLRAAGLRLVVATARTPLGVDKGSGTRQALALLGVNPAAAIGFGDMPNDLPMFAVTARGYAVGNHHPAMRAAADEIIDPVERDGFARKIGELADAEWTLP